MKKFNLEYYFSISATIVTVVIAFCAIVLAITGTIKLILKMVGL